MATNSRHPFLKEQVLYVVNAPGHVDWVHIQRTITGCEKITQASKTQSSSPRSDQHVWQWGIRFVAPYYAEMALATLQGAPFVGLSPPVMMELSHSSTLQSPEAVPRNRLFPQYVKVLTHGVELFPGQTITAQLAFKCFRNAGPLVSVRVNVATGDQQSAITIEYFEEKHATSALRRGNDLHKKLRNQPQFTLRRYDPCSLRCSGFSPSFSYKQLIDTFSPFGSVYSATLENVGKQNMHGVVTFVSPISAAQALQALDGKPMGSAILVVRYVEPAAQHVFLRPAMPQTPPLRPESTSTANSSVPPTDSPRQTAEDAARAKAEQLRREDVARELREAAARQTREAAAREAAEAKVKKAKERQCRRQEAEHTHVKARQRLEEARNEGTSALQDLAAAKNAQEEADMDWEQAQEACAEAKRIWLEWMDRSMAAKARASSAQEAVSNALQRKLQADRNIKVAEHEEASSRAEKEELETGASDVELDEETLRQAELAESIRKIRELREMEVAEKEEKARKARQAEEDRLRREREEIERAAREQREREERERREAEAKKREAEAKKRLYNQAVAKEQERCRLRDAGFCPVLMAWHDQLAFERFKLVSDEFDGLKFHESQPLTFKSVPWPLLVRPSLMTFDTIDWSAVEKFFDAVENLLEDKVQYKAFVEKAHRRFHPDKWRARGILNSVQDEELRGRMEAAGNVVAQAITPLWLKSRQ